MSFTGMPVSAGRVYFLGAGEAEIGPLPDSLFRDDALANLAAPSRPFTVAVVEVFGEASGAAWLCNVGVVLATSCGLASL